MDDAEGPLCGVVDYRNGFFFHYSSTTHEVMLPA